ncbi:MAG: CBS domain-containing protein [Gammaproteobacteria bacterium]
MELKNVMTPTGVARPGMTVREGFRESLQCAVPGIPYVDESGKVVGRFSIRETLRRACIPDVMVRYADLLGDTPGCLVVSAEHAPKLLDLPLLPFVKYEVARITPNCALATAVALMERHTTNYLFVIDHRDHYVGVVTVWAIAGRMLELDL